jgi:hypothetical protein
VKKILFLIFIVSIYGCNEKKKEEKEMQIDGSTERTYCIGRHFINFPKKFIESPVSTGFFRNSDVDAQGRGFDVVIRSEEFTPTMFKVEVQKRRLEIKNAEDGNVDVLRLDKALSNDATMFRIQKIEDGYVSEIHMLRGASLVVVKLNSFRNQYAAAEEALIRFVAMVRDPRNRGEAHRYKGFCLGSLIFEGEFLEENGSTSFKDNAGQSFEVDIDTYAPEEDVPLLKRMSGPNSLLNLFQVDHTVLRARERTVAGMHAQEWLGWAKTREGENAKQLKFALDTMRERPTKSTPRIELTFDTAQPLENGLPTKTVISDDDAIELWDSVVNSIRPVPL